MRCVCAGRPRWTGQHCGCRFPLGIRTRSFGCTPGPQPMSWVRVAAGHAIAKPSARTAATPAPDVDASDDRWMRAGQETGRTQSRLLRCSSCSFCCCPGAWRTVCCRTTESPRCVTLCLLSVELLVRRPHRDPSV